MNQRLVESVAQIILSMTDDERQLLDRKLQDSDLQRLPEPVDAEKSLRIAELAQDIHNFEEMYSAPLSELPADRWAVASPVQATNKKASPHNQRSEHDRFENGSTENGSVNGELSNGSPKAYSSLLPEVLSDWSGIEEATENTTTDHPEQMNSFIQLTPSVEADSANSNVDLGRVIGNASTQKS